MSQAQVAYISPPPRSQDKMMPSQDYPVAFPMFQPGQTSFPESLAPSFAELGSFWSPTPHGMLPNPPFDGTQTSDLMGMNNDPLWTCEGFLPNAVPNSLPLLPKEEPIPFNLGMPTASYIESSPSIEPIEMKPLTEDTTPQFQPQCLDPAAAPEATTDISLRSRRNSAPELNAQDLAQVQQRQLKHASRRASHNIVEKRYRINLNSKFRKLEEVVLKGTEPYSSSTTKNSTLSTRRQQSPKASIIDSALNYIESLQSEVNVLKSKVEFFENPCFAHNEGGGNCRSGAEK
ncbi:hypothetical protein P175DRAFT_0491899 [Aspergillus ochraceoroseus IBT 24754]|uniref:BHLH domain-containing protein n=1 Tax=Aspergillus ochraceoroseus IBT 24754 TaxID=1392256 RepID=A0A2T5M4U1_9EURO|nr:uncharacterized protein P175DRAFT_0491899 [Aspergillus ochraceoroseus IBT 24754]PTU23549.1 hypothetical protein P175DRAFT_0491899 [Aspergillus ochraceoroseus IBT 24754]